MRGRWNTTRGRVAGAVLALGLLASGSVALAQDGGGGTKPEVRSTAATPTAISSQAPETKFVPVTPCRVVDTRLAGGRLVPGTIRTFNLISNDLTGQGGSATGCGIPSRASAMSVVITAVDPLGTGFLRGNSAPSILVEPTLPNATLVNYSSALNASVGIELPICSNYSGGIFILCSGAFVLGSFVRATHVVVDIVGYHARPVYAIVDDTGIFRKQIGFESVVKTGEGLYTLTALDNVSGCVVTPAISASDTGDGVTPGFTIVADGGSLDGTILVRIQNNAGLFADEDFTVTLTC